MNSIIHPHKHFDEYLKEHDTHPYYPELIEMYKSIFPEELNKLKHLIFYGQEGCGKYTQMLQCIRKYSPSDLKYEKKIVYTNEKSSYIIKLSDIHYEIDMGLLGCNSKILWNELYHVIVDAILAHTGNKTGIIVCKSFHEIHGELLDVFYSYMQTTYHSSLNIIFILLTDHMSFIPSSILDKCYVVRIPHRNSMVNLYNTRHKEIKQKQRMKLYTEQVDMVKNRYIPLCNEIIKYILHPKGIPKFYSELRERIYELFIYQHHIQECMYYIISVLMNKLKMEFDLNGEKLNECMHKICLYTNECIHYYNNNYRPIYHLERWIIYITRTVYNLKTNE
jgi:hypothetical protein